MLFIYISYVYIYKNVYTFYINACVYYYHVNNVLFYVYLYSNISIILVILKILWRVFVVTFSSRIKNLGIILLEDNEYFFFIISFTFNIIHSIFLKLNYSMIIIFNLIVLPNQVKILRLSKIEIKLKCSYYHFCIHPKFWYSFL